jgi:acetyl-CoA carboxylase biotin carboxyl carrier protein
LDLKDLREILQILEGKDISEFELEQDGMKLRIRKGDAGFRTSPTDGVDRTPSGPAAGAAPGAAPVAAAAPTETDPGVATVKSPIVGTFYRSPDPNSPAFVSVGDRVRVGQVLCIIEAMKLMNEIESDVAGEVVKVHRESGQPVQYGDPLFAIRPGE